VNNRAEEAIREVQSGAIEIESELTTSYLRQFIGIRTQLLIDFARQPILTNAVMGSNSSKAALFDYLDNYKILGQSESISVVNVLQKNVYKNNNILAEIVAKNPSWLSEILEGKLSHAVVLTNSESRSFFIIAVPIIYNDLSEGALIVKFNTPLEKLLPLNYKSVSHAITLVGTWVNYSNLTTEDHYIRVAKKPIANTGIELDYFIKSKELSTKVSAFMADITLSLILGLLISTAMLFIFGRHLLLNPFKQLEASKDEIKLSEARYELAVNGSNDGIWDWEIKTNAVYYSPRIKILLGYDNKDTSLPPDSIKMFKALIHPDDYTENKKKLVSHLTYNEPYDHQYRLKTKQGDYRYFRAKGMALRNKKGFAIRMAGSITDITAQRVFQEALKKAKERNDLLAQAIESCHLGITIADATKADLPIVFANSEFSNITGYRLDEILNKNCRILQGKKTDKAVIQSVKNAIKNLETLRVEVLNYKKDGRSFWNNLQVSPVFDGTKKLTAFIGIQQDITTQVLARESLIEAKAQAEQANKAKSEFLASMSHEIRTPMNGVLGMLNLLIDNSLNEKQHYQTHIALNSANSLLNLINDILDFSKVDAGKLELEDLEFDLRAMLGVYAKSAAIHAQAKDIELILDVSDIGPTLVIGDAGRIRQIMTNLVNNALKFTDSGKVTIISKTKPQNEKKLLLTCEIEDSGIGISKEQQGKLFKSFSQVDSSTTRKYGGTGLGLAIVKKLCELMQGDVSVTSTKNVGSTFRFTIQLRVSNNAKIFTAPYKLEKLNILLVDNNNHSEAINRQCEKWGANVTICNSAQHALIQCKLLLEKENRVYDLAFINEKLNDMTALELGHTLMNDSNIKPLNQVLMSPINYQGDNHTEFGFNHYFAKPATTHDILTSLALCQPTPSDGHTSIANTHTLEPTLHSKNIQWQKGIRVLLAEDNQINQIVAKTTLNKMGLLVIDVAANGQEVIDFLAHMPSTDPYSIIFMDCQMPIMDGYQATKIIRQNEEKSKVTRVPIIAMTANAMVGDKEKCIAAGMDDYISKPIDQTTLFKTLLKWLPYTTK
jgi:PAS domain S-box-containing protein